MDNGPIYRDRNAFGGMTYAASVKVSTCAYASAVSSVIALSVAVLVAMCRATSVNGRDGRGRRVRVMLCSGGGGSDCSRDGFCTAVVRGGRATWGCLCKMGLC